MALAGCLAVPVRATAAAAQEAAPGLGGIAIAYSPFTVFPPPTTPGASAVMPGTFVPLPDDAFLAITGWAGPFASVMVGPCGEPGTVVAREANGSHPLEALARTHQGDCLSVTARSTIYVERVGDVVQAPEHGLRYVPVPDAPVITEVDSKTYHSGLMVDLSAVIPAGTQAVHLAVDAWSTPISEPFQAGFTVAPSCFDNGFSFGLKGVDQLEGRVLTRLADFGGSSYGHSICLRGGVQISGSSSQRVDVRVRILGYLLDDAGPRDTEPSMRTLSAVPTPGLRPEPPTRVLDTRTGVGATARPVEAGEVVRVDLAAQAGEGGLAAALNLTATESEGWGYVTAYPCGDEIPNVSNVNVDLGRSVANHAVVPLDATGGVCLVPSVRMHLIADLTGVFDLGAPDRFTTLAPTRALDTRSSGGIDAGGVARVQIAGRYGVPAGATAVSFTLTAVEPAGWGYVTAYPCDVERPNASNLNYTAGSTTANLVTVKLAADGSLCLSTYAASHLLVDLTGVYWPGGDAGFRGVQPERWVDTRVADGGPLPAGERGSVLFQWFADLDPVSVVANLTVTETSDAGFLSAYPNPGTVPLCGTGEPAVSTLNFRAADTVAAAAIVQLVPHGTMCVFTSSTAHVIVDVAGFMAREPYWLARG